MSEDFRRLTDLASRTLGGSVVHANDESFADRHHLLRPQPPAFDPAAFGHRGKVYDGWETRRRREPGHDAAVVRLGAPGIVRGVIVDTSWFTGNYPPEASVEAAWVSELAGVDEVLAADWETIVPRSRLQGDAENAFAVDSPRRWTHVRLSIYPDGGVARFRVHGEVVADPELLDALGTVDLAALEHGGRVVACSDRFYSRPENLLAPGLARVMGEGWETARRRDDGNDWVVVELAAAGRVRVAEIDTTWFLGNAPGEAALSALDATVGADPADPGAWRTLLPRMPLVPDMRHRFVLEPVRSTHVRLDVYPDGGLARLRLWGGLDSAGRERLRRRWAAAGPRTGGAP